jgi:hypothetical protein
MTHTTIRIVAMFHPSTTAEGKLYIACLDAKAPFAIYGANRPNSSGTLTAGKSAAEMEKKTRDKQKEGYKVVDPTTLSAASRNHFAQELVQRLGLQSDTSVSWSPDGRSVAVNSATNTGAAPQTTTPRQKPILWNRGDVDVWI